MPAFHRFHDETSKDALKRYKKKLSKVTTIDAVQAIVKCTKNNAKLNFDDVVEIETLAALKHDDLRASK